MKVLFLVQKEQRVILHRLYDSICRHLRDCEVRWLTSREQDNLKQYFQNIDVHAYERIIFFLRFKKEIRQVRFIQSIPNLVILEHDAFQNYIIGKYRGKFSKHYHKLPWARVICSGYEVTKKLCAEGFDVKFVPKGYDQTLLGNRGLERDIELGFVGSIGNQVYDKRRLLLEALAEQENLVVTRTQSGADYAAMLNRIRIFVSADVGFGEYMIKNFEAMACGCLLLTWSQGEEENQVLGFRDMENVVLYSSIDELREKLVVLRTTPGMAESIASAGQRLVEQYYSWEVLGGKVAKAVQLPLRKKRVKRFMGLKHYSLVT